MDQPFLHGFADGTDTIGSGDIVFPLLCVPLQEHLLKASLPHRNGFRVSLHVVEAFQFFDPFWATSGSHQLANEYRITSLGLQELAVLTLVLVGHDVTGEFVQIGWVNVV